MSTLVICSGGLDSVTLAHRIAAEGRLSRLVSFDYGQRHRKELDFAAAAAQRLAVPHQVIDLSGVGAALTGSALTDAVDVPDGHYAEETMRITVVPNRNAIMLAVAFGVAAAQDGCRLRIGKRSSRSPSITRSAATSRRVRRWYSQVCT